MALADALTGDDVNFGALDAAMIPDLRALRRDGPAHLRRPALIALLHLGGEQALDPADLAVLRRLIAIKLPRDRPQSIDGCFNSWLTVRGGDRAGILRVLGLDRSEPATYGLGETLVAHLGHGGPDHSRTWRHVFVSPELQGWTVVAGPSCDPDDEALVEGWVEQLSEIYGDAQAYFFGSQGDGDAWLTGARGRITRRFSSNHPETATGDPLPIERRVLGDLGWTGRPEDLDPDEDDRWFDFLADCSAPRVAAELSIDPVWTTWPADLETTGHPLIAWPASDDGVSILRDCYTFGL